MDGADVLVYTVAAPSGENVDREDLKIEAEDRHRLPETFRAAKGRGMRTVVILNVPGPVEMGDWEQDAAAILCIFFPGRMGGQATAAMLAGRMVPGGRLPVSFPFRVQDTPAYPNFPGEYRDVYYGEGVFVGYRSYDKRELPVRYPFGYGLSYTTFTQELVGESFTFDTVNADTLTVPVRVRNTGRRPGSQVIQTNNDGEQCIVVNQGRKSAENADTIVYCMGLPDGWESEGFDRTHLRLPENQIHLLERLHKQGKPVIVYLFAGAPVLMDWQVHADAPRPVKELKGFARCTVSGGRPKP